MSPRALLLALAASLLAARASAGEPHARARLIAGSDAVVAGSELELGLTLQVAEGWHVYWRHPGESGAPPQLELTLPEGWEQAGPLRWPAPGRLVIPGELVNHVYEGEVTILVPVRLSAQAQAGEVELRGRATWLVCDADGCVSEEAPLRLKLRVVAPGGEAPVAGPDAERLGRARAALPRAPRADELQASWDGTTLVLRVPGARELTFFPALPEDPLPDELAEAAHAAGETLRLPYPARIGGAGKVAGHLRARVGEAEQQLWVEIAGPGDGAR